MRRFWDNLIGPAIVLFVVLLLFPILVACARTPPINPVVRMDCAQPATDALAPAQPLPLLPKLSPQPDVAVTQQNQVLAGDASAFDREAKRRETLIDHGVKFCGWVR